MVFRVVPSKMSTQSSGAINNATYTSSDTDFLFAKATDDIVIENKEASHRNDTVSLPLLFYS